ncbi:MAG: ATP-binding protein [Pseudomonadota bacterium]
MDPVLNPYAPTAGWPPPEFAGRDDLIETADIAMRRILAGRQANSIVMRGLRGVGKTVVLKHLQPKASALGFETLDLEVPDAAGGHLLTRLVPQLSATLIRLSRRKRAEAYVKRAQAAFQNLVSVFSIKYEGISVGVDPATPEASTGQLDIDLPELLGLIAEAAKADGRGIAIFIDEIQYLSKEELSALSLTAHDLGQRQLPFLLIGCGLPQIAAAMADAKSYAERLFDFPELGPLDPVAARRVLAIPAKSEGVEFTDDALDSIVEKTRAYPYFLQTWGKFCWDLAEHSPITAEDVETAGPEILAHLDRNFFRVRYDRCSNAERQYLRGLAELGPGEHASGRVAQVLGTTSDKISRIRAGLIDIGMVYSPEYGMTAFTVPKFDAFMRRVMPELAPYKPQRGVK